MPQKAEIVLTKHGIVQIMGVVEINGQYARADIMNALRTGNAFLRPVLQEGEEPVTPSGFPLIAGQGDTEELRVRRGRRRERAHA